MQTVEDGILTNYEIFNPKAKDTLVFLHGWGSSLQFWIPVSKLLTKSYRIILVDLPGFGKSMPFQFQPDIPDYTEFIRKFASSLNLEKFTLAGYSFGGQITLDYALKYPHDLTSIILISPAISKEKRRIISLKARMTKSLKPILSNAPSDQIEQLIGWVTPKEYEGSNEYQKALINKIIKYNLKPFLTQITLPVNIIWGNIDMVVPNIGDYLAKKIPKAQFHIISGANHLIYLTHLDELAKTLNKILTH